MVDVIVVCITVIVLAGMAYHFGSQYMTRAKTLEAQLVFNVKAKVADDLVSIEKFRTDILSDIKSLADNHMKLLENQKQLATAIQMNSSAGRGSILSQVLKAKDATK